MTGSWKTAAGFLGLSIAVLATFGVSRAPASSPGPAPRETLLPPVPLSPARAAVKEPPPARRATRADASSLACVAWAEESCLAGAIANRSREDLLVDACANVPGDCLCYAPEIPRRDVRVAARSVTLVRFSRFSWQGRHTRSFAIRGENGAILDRIDCDRDEAVAPHLARRGSTFTYTWRPATEAGVDIVAVSGETGALVGVEPGPGAYVIEPRARSRSSIEERLVLLAHPAQGAEIRGILACESGVLVASVGGAPVRFTFDTARVEGSVLRPVFRGWRFEVDDRAARGPTALPPVLIHERDMIVVEAPDDSERAR